MQTVEFTAKSVADATQVAADKLGVSADQITVTVLEETRGLFGKSNLRVRAEVVASAAAPTTSPKAEAPAKDAKPKGRGRAEKKSVEEPAPEVAAPQAAAPAVEEPAAKPKGRGRGKPEPKATEAPAGSEEEGPETEESEIQATQEDGDRLADLLRELLVAADLEVSVKVSEVSGRYASLQIDGKDAAHLVGKHGEVLNALQYLVNIIAGRRIDNGIRATIDGNDYRRRREETLTQLATTIAEQVKKRGEEAVLDALPAFERRVVHKALSVIEGVATYSEGEEPNRRVVIAPAE